MTAPTPTEICTLINNSCQCVPSESLSRLYMLILLCSINTNTGGGGGTPTPIVNLPAKSIAFGTLTNAYATTSFLDSSAIARELGVTNNTNQDVQISYDGTTNGPIIPAGQFRPFEYGADGRVLSATDIWIKYLNGVAPTLGAVLLDGFY